MHKGQKDRLICANYMLRVDVSLIEIVLSVLKLTITKKIKWVNEILNSFRIILIVKVDALVGLICGCDCFGSCDVKGSLVTTYMDSWLPLTMSLIVINFALSFPTWYSGWDLGLHCVSISLVLFILAAGLL